MARFAGGSSGFVWRKGEWVDMALSPWPGVQLREIVDEERGIVHRIVWYDDPIKLMEEFAKLPQLVIPK